MKSRLLSFLCTLLMSVGVQAQNAEFETAAEAVKNMKIGWNLWNTLDSHSGVPYDPANYKSLETGWGNPVTKAELMKMMRKAGFNAIRVPVTWFPYTDENGNVDSRWMKRVHEVVDYVIDQGMYCLLNVHHDTGEYEASWIRADETNYQKNHKRFENIWRQIAEEFKDYDEHLLFEGYNEMLDTKNQWGEPIWNSTEEEARSSYEALNKYAQSFVDAVRGTGGNNLFRNLVVNDYGASVSDNAIEHLVIPKDDAANHIAFQIHYYPDGVTLTEKEIDEIIGNWNKAVQSKGTPLIVGEWGLGTTHGSELTFRGLIFQGLGFTVTSVVLIPGESNGAEADEEITLWEGNQVFDNWGSIIEIDGAKFANAKAGDIVRVYYKDKKDDFYPHYNHFNYSDWTDFQDHIDIQETYFQAPITEAVLADIYDRIVLLNRYFIEKTKANDIATFNWEGPICWGPYRSLPAFMSSEYINAVMKGYYGDEYEPILKTEDEYDFLGVKVSFDYNYAELMMYDEGELHQYLDLNEYKGIRIVLENIDGIVVKAYGEADGKEKYFLMSSPEETFSFDKSELGNKIRSITLQNWKEGKNETKILNAYLVKKDGTEESIDINQYRVYHDCEFEITTQRKQFVHTVAYDYQWAELNIFYDDIPLKLKNYKGIRLELAEMPKDVHVKVYGDGEQKEDYISIADASSTILFNTDIFSREVNRVTLQYTKEDKGEAKVIGAWLIRQDGTEEYSDLSLFHGCEITKVEKYVPEPPVTIAAKDLTMTYGDEVPELTYTAEGGDLNGTPKLSTTATKTSPVGTYPIKVERGTVANTQATFVDGTLTITQAPLTVGVQDATITEGDAIPTFTLTYDSWRNNDSEATAFTKKPTAKTSATNKSKAGTYTITVSGGEAKNYKLSYQNGTLTIKEKEAPSPWMSLVLNCDLEGNDVSGFYKREDAAKVDKIVPAAIVDGAGKNNSRGIVIQSTDNPPENWNTQFFIRLTQSLPAGTKYRMSLDYKASQNADVPMESHAEPGDYIYWDFGSLSFTKSWKHYEKEGTITAEQSTAEKKMHSIAFNLANIATATTYYFDNIVFEIDQTTDIMDMNADNHNKTVIYNLGGQRLSEPHKGINIINGKKVIMK